MDLSTWLLYISVISILLLSPGPSGLLCLSDGLKFGHKKAIPTVLGGATSALVLMTISAIGLGAVLAASTTLFLVIKLLGAAYLIYLGLMAWKEGGIKIEANTSNTKTLINYSAFKRYQKGFMVGISNPKDLLFFIALFPSFMNTELPAFNQYMILASTWFVLECISMFMYVCLGSKISPFLSKPTNVKFVNRSVASIFIFLGGALALSTVISKDV